MVYVENPLTGYAIKKNGPTYNKLREEGWDVDDFRHVRKGYRSPEISMSPHRRPHGATVRTARRVGRRTARRYDRREERSMSPGCGCASMPPSCEVRKSPRRISRVSISPSRSLRNSSQETSRVDISPARAMRRSPQQFSRKYTSPTRAMRRSPQEFSRKYTPVRVVKQTSYPRSMSPRAGYTKRGKKIGRLPEKSKVMALPVANPRPLQETLADIPKSRKAKRRDLEREISKGKEGRGMRTRGWKAAAPQKGIERHDLMKECGEGCFLQPETEGFPICPALREKQGCSIDCRGVTSALVRARQWGYNNVADLAKEIQDKKCGREA